jgi:uncharacterized protein (TIGR02001 family)
MKVVDLHQEYCAGTGRANAVLHKFYFLFFTFIRRVTMKKSLIAAALAGLFALPAVAQTNDESKDAAAPASPHSFTANVGLFSSYRFRGIDQTFGKPALQGGIDYAHESGFYVGNWNSNVSSGAGFPDGNLEMDFYGGWKKTFGDFGLDIGGLYYYYPGTTARPLSGSNAKNPGATSSGTVDNFEIYVAGSWKFLTLKYNYSLTDYFSLPDSKGTSYLDLAANYEVADGWFINAHVGHLWAPDFKYNTAGNDNIDYTDWKLGVTKVIDGWSIALAYVGTNAKGSCNQGEFYCFASSFNGNGQFGSSTKDAGRGIAVLSVSRAF